MFNFGGYCAVIQHFGRVSRMLQGMHSLSVSFFFFFKYGPWWKVSTTIRKISICDHLASNLVELLDLWTHSFESLPAAQSCCATCTPVRSCWCQQKYLSRPRHSKMKHLILSVWYLMFYDYKLLWEYQWLQRLSSLWIILFLDAFALTLAYVIHTSIFSLLPQICHDYAMLIPFLVFKAGLCFFSLFGFTVFFRGEDFLVNT